MPGSWSRASSTCKDGGREAFIIQDGAMNDLIRPTLYDAYHDIMPVDEKLAQAETMMEADVVGRHLRIGRLSRQVSAGCRSCSSRAT
jgi:hypothetical protein